MVTDLELVSASRFCNWPMGLISRQQLDSLWSVKEINQLKEASLEDAEFEEDAA
jgi:hypothetical protein